MANKYLKPMLDTGSPRVFNCNEMTQRVMAKEPEATPFFRNKQLNSIVLIKDAMPASERREGMPMIGTKLYFPFNDVNIYEGGRTIFLHDQYIEQSIMGHFGEGAIAKDKLAEDMNILHILDRLPSLDPFLMKDVFQRHKLPMTEAYFEISAESWNEIQTYMLQRFEPLVRAAFPDSESSDDKAKQLIDKIWEARDIVALQPLIDAFRLPQAQALDLFGSWRGIVYYSFQYQCGQKQMVELIKWLKEFDKPVAGIPTPEMKEVLTAIAFVIEQLKKEWKNIDDIVRSYQDSYDKMFKYKVSSSEFISFLKNSNVTYWSVGNSIGKATYAIYCWDVMSSRYDGRKMPWAPFKEVIALLNTIFEVEKKAATNMAWT